VSVTRLVIILVGVLFIGIETHYFGYNMIPQSAAEAICDGIGLLIIIIGIVPIKVNLTINVRYTT
jgi:xanthine/uracil/vitamin C permease (AzgA family)